MTTPIQLRTIIGTCLAIIDEPSTTIEETLQQRDVLINAVDLYLIGKHGDDISAALPDEPTIIQPTPPTANGRLQVPEKPYTRLPAAISRITQGGAIDQQSTNNRRGTVRIPILGTIS